MIHTFVIKKPIITEQSLKDAQNGIYTFEARLSARKPEIKRAIQDMYNVHVTGMSTMIRKGKMKTAGKKRQKINKPDRKKVKIWVAKGEKISAFELGQS
jgi:large subunit ribosomal protein L23